MRALIFLSLAAIVVLSCLSTCLARDLKVGVKNASRGFTKRVFTKGISDRKIIKEVFFFDPKQQTIKGVMAMDLDHSKGIATITAGGVGSSFVNIRLKSAPGRRLNYRIKIYL